jgi:hypothetical protein
VRLQHPQSGLQALHREDAADGMKLHRDNYQPCTGFFQREFDRIERS